MKRYIPGWGIAEVEDREGFWRWQQGTAEVRRERTYPMPGIAVELICWESVLIAMRTKAAFRLGSMYQLNRLRCGGLPTDVALAWASASVIDQRQRAAAILRRTWPEGPEPLRKKALRLLDEAPKKRRKTLGPTALHCDDADGLLEDL